MKHASPGVWLFRGAFMTLLALYFGVIFAAMRALQGHFGWSIASALVALVPTIIMAVFVVPLAVFARLPEHWVEQHLPARRWRQGLCPACGYARPRGEAPPVPANAGTSEAVEPAASAGSGSTPASARCAECGATLRRPSYVELSSASLRAFMWMALTALLLGSAVAEACVQIDEYRFQREAERARRVHPDAPYERPRQWPGSFTRLRWDPQRGFEAEAPGLTRRH